MRARRLLRATAVTTVLAVAPACGGSGSPGGSSAVGGGGAVSGSAADSATISTARAFLDRYVARSGRVIRHDQGGDTVSEGEAYGLLLAEVAGEPGVARRIWQWTAANLQRSDGLISWHTDASGHVVDPQSAGDADVLIAWALERYAGRDATTMHAAGRRIARAVLGSETVRTSSGPLVAAGPWAVTTSPPTVNPSYWSFPAFSGLTGGDSRWTSASRAARVATRALADDGHRLPPDWAGVTGGTVRAEPAPSGAAQQYGPDAQRLVVFLAASCSASDRAVAARLWPTLSASSARLRALALHLGGTVIDPTRVPLALVASGAAAGAAGHRARRTSLLDSAARLNREFPTYYGTAWVALGRGFLTGPLRCTS